MKKKYFLNANIIDPQNSLDEIGGLIIDEEGKIEAIGKKVNEKNIPSREKYIDLKGKYIFPGIVDMRVFVGEPGYEYKENFRTLSNAALSGGVTSVVTMPNTNPIIDNVSMVDFLKRRGRDKSKINIFPTASIFPASLIINPPISSKELPGSIIFAFKKYFFFIYSQKILRQAILTATPSSTCS